MASKLLSDAKARSAKPGRYPDGENLYLQVSPGGGKSWLLRYKLNEKRREMGLGTYPAVSLDSARKQAQAARDALAEGKDPLAHRSAVLVEKAANAKTFEEAARALIKLKDDNGHWKKTRGADDAYPDKSRKQWESTLQTYVYPVFGAKGCNEVTYVDVASALRPIWAKINETARRLRGRVEDVLDYAAAMKWRDAERANAARWEGPLEYAINGGGKQRTKQAVNLPSLPRAKMFEFMQQLRTMPGGVPSLLEWTILSSVRSSEARLARAEEIDYAARVWNIPGSRMKIKGKAHRVPLSPRMLEILKGCPKEGYLFPSTRTKGPFSTNTMDALIERMGYAGSCCVHGFRTTFKDWADEEVQADDLLSERALAHKIPGKVKIAYLRGDALDKRRPLMADWAKFCATKYRPANVVPLRKAA